MKDAPSDFWGKLRRDTITNEVIEWHPLVDHSADVAACVAALLELPTWRHRLASLCGREDLDESTCARLAVLAALHDLGKFNLGFQAKGRVDLGVTAGHVEHGVAAVGQDVTNSVEVLGEWGDGTTGLLVAALCHHGRPYSYLHPVPFEAALWRPRAGLDPRAGIEGLMGAVRVWFPVAFEKGGEELPEDPRFEHAYAGLVMLADWIGSDEKVFPYSHDRNGDRLALACQRATRFTADSWLNIYEDRRADQSDRAAFIRVAPPNYACRPAQAAIIELATNETGSITVLESDTGSGKTEAAIARFVTLYSAGTVDGMYFALPTRSAATQIYKRVVAATKRAFSEPPPVVLAVPGYLSVDDVVGKPLPKFEVQWPDNDDERFRYRAWAGETPKRYLAGCIVVGTIDQVLLSALRVRHAHLRATALLRQFLVVDEVHASDAYMTRILEDVLDRHIRAGGHALLLSATLGSETRARLLRPGTVASLPHLKEAIAQPYPLISHRGRSEIAIAVKQVDSGRRVSLEPEPWLEDPNAIARAALDAAWRGARVLVIRNTVTDCVATQSSLELLAEEHGRQDVLFTCRNVSAPHHARFARVDRAVLDDALEKVFGKDRPSVGSVVIATQTVQQSLDLDADLLLSDLCPIDVLLQRIGRLHRHTRERPSGFEFPCAKVLVPANRDLGTMLGEQGRVRPRHGLGIVYPDLRMLEAAWRRIEENPVWRLPEMNRSLVEESIHSEALEAVAASLGGHWQAHGQQMLGAIRGEARLADLNVVEWTKPYSETTFSSSKDERITTRLGEGDRRVHFEQPFMGPFGLSVKELILPGRWVVGASPTECEASNVTSGGVVTRFQFAGRQFVYDPHGVRPEKREAQEIASDDGP